MSQHYHPPRREFLATMGAMPLAAAEKRGDML
jgi:hypothetical protein